MKHKLLSITYATFVKSLPCQLFEQDIHREQNYDRVSNKIHFQIYLSVLIVPCNGQLFSSRTVKLSDRSNGLLNELTRFLFDWIPFVCV